MQPFPIHLGRIAIFKIHRNNYCGLDVHKTWIYACIGTTDTNGRTEYKEARFSTFSRGLRDLATWLDQHSHQRKNRAQNCLTISNLKLDDVFSDVFGQSARSITEYILAHPGEPFDVAPFIDRRCKHPLDEIQAAVDGAISREQAIKLREYLDHIDELEKHRAKIESEILSSTERYSLVLDLLHTVPGFSANPMTAISTIAEIGTDMSVFPKAKPLCSRAGCCPRNDQSGGKVKSTRISHAGSCLKPLLVQVANAVIRSKKHPEFAERYRRIKTRRGHKKAIIAVCCMLLTAIWNILSKQAPYSPDGFLSPRSVNQAKVLTKSRGLELLRLRGYAITDDPPLPTSA